MAASGRREKWLILFHWPSKEMVGRASRPRRSAAESSSHQDGRRLATANNPESTALIWDVASLVNRPLPAVAKPTKAELRRWWAELRDDDPATAYKAISALVAVPSRRCRSSPSRYGRSKPLTRRGSAFRSTTWIAIVRGA